MTAGNASGLNDGAAALVTTGEGKFYSNGLDLEVEGRRGAGGFQVSGSAGTASLPECVMSFAYWNPGFLEQPRLLNPQTGEYLEVEVRRGGKLYHQRYERGNPVKGSTILSISLSR